jgi:hypothetical protein
MRTNKRKTKHHRREFAPNEEFSIVSSDLTSHSDFFVRDASDYHFRRMRIIYENGWELSVIRGDASFGGRYGLFEIALFNNKGMVGDVIGDLTKEKVFEYIARVQVGTVGDFLT